MEGKGVVISPLNDVSSITSKVEDKLGNSQSEAKQSSSGHNLWVSGLA